ncbi:MAG: hypothetical protein ACFE0R_11960 [Salinarimonas sp.]
MTRHSRRVPRLAFRSAALLPAALLFAGFLFAGLLAAGLLSAPALATDAPQTRDTVPRVAQSLLGPHHCMCRAFGQAFEPGALVCLGERLAECTIEINVMSWRRTGEACPES